MTRPQFVGQPTKIGERFLIRRARQTLEWCQATNILEIGPGRGILAREAIRQRKTYTGMDRDMQILTDLPEGAKRIYSVLPSVLSDPSSMGAVVCESVIEHMESCKDASKLLCNIRATLKPGGRLVLRFPDIRYAGTRFWESVPDHQFVTSLARVAILAEQHGYCVVKAGRYVDCFTGLTAYAIGAAVRCIPTRTLHALTGKGHNPSLWSKLQDKFPQAYLVLQRQEHPPKETI